MVWTLYLPKKSLVVVSGPAGYMHGPAGYMVTGPAGYMHGPAGYMVGQPITDLISGPSFELTF